MQRTVTVTGHGAASAVPDSAVVRVAATHRAGSVAQAVAGVDSVLATLTRVARGFTEGAGIRSSGMQVWPAHDHEGRPDGFEASHQLSVRCPNLPAASALVTGLAEEVGDALRIEGIALEVSDAGTAEVTAREAAYADARARATHLAGLEGSGLAGVVTLVEGAVAAPGGEAMSRASGLEPGESLVRSSVTVTWQLA